MSTKHNEQTTFISKDNNVKMSWATQFRIIGCAIAMTLGWYDVHTTGIRIEKRIDRAIYVDDMDRALIQLQLKNYDKGLKVPSRQEYFHGAQQMAPSSSEYTSNSNPILGLIK